jgi:hypothetical protein
MAHFKPIIFFITLSLVFTLLTGCGGGGGGTNIVPETETVASPVFNILPFIPTPPYQSHQLAVNAPTAWEQGFSGQNTIIAAIDSGINLNHTDFTDRSGTRLVDDINATGFKFSALDNTVYQVNDYNDTEGHGTYVSSIASGQEYGIAPSSAILPIKVFFDQLSIDSRVINTALPYAATRADVINTSISGMINPINIGTTNSYDIYRSALSTNNVVLVTAAGNDAQPIGVQHFDLNSINRNLSIDPELINKVLNVISVDANGVRSTFSNTPGSCADVSPTADIPCNETVMTQIQNNFISAPGERIIAATEVSSTSTALVSGTSMATPIVSGSVSLLLSAWDQLTPMDAVGILKTSANRSFVNYTPAEYGVGLLDIAAALEPIGTLKAATTGSAAQLTINHSTATISASLASIKTSSLLQRAAYFDDYNRDFSVNTTANIRIQKNSIDWSTHWHNASFNSRYTQTLPLGEHQLSITHDPSSQRLFKSLSLTGEQYALRYLSGGTSNALPQQIPFSLEQLTLDSNAFIGKTSLSNVSDILTLQYQLSPSMTLSSNAKWEKSYALNTRSNTIDTATQLGLTYQATPNLYLGLGIELYQEHNALFGLQGEGTLSFGKQNQTQLSVLSANYRHGNSQFYGLIKTGKLIQTQATNASYITLQNATIGQSLLGVRHQLDTQTHIGIQAYRTLGITSANMTLTVPVGMDSNGTVQTLSETLQYQESLLPNTLELYYRSQPIKNLNYTLNAITGEHDSGLGITLNRRF